MKEISYNKIGKILKDKKALYFGQKGMERKYGINFSCKRKIE